MLGLLLLAILLVLFPLGAAAAGPAERAQPISPQEETLSVGDKVTVSVFGQADLSGDFVLDGTGSVQMPLIGRIAIAGLTPQQAENRIRDGLTDGYLRDAVVSLRIAELKPGYIMGEVRTPGSYPFRHGLNVLGAVALAGGYRTADQSLSVLKSELLLAEDRLRGLDTTLQMLTARRVRGGERRHRRPRGVAGDAAAVSEAAEEVARPAECALDEHQADELLAERQRRAEAEQHGVVNVESPVIVLDVRAVAHDVVPIRVARRVHVADAHVPLLDLARAAQHELVDDDGLRLA